MNTYIEANQFGILVLPEETQDEYKKRLHLAPSCPKEDLAELETMYDIRPASIDVTYSNERLSFFEAGCTWMQDDEQGKKAWIQLRKIFQYKDRYLFFYSKAEVLAHEYVHAIRYPLGSNKFEEFFAYYLSKNQSRLRAFLGPLFETSRDTYFFLLSFILPFCYSLIFSLTWMLPEWLGPLFFLLPVATTLYFTLRLLTRWRILYRCKNVLKQVVKGNPLHLMVRLTDEEIELFAHKDAHGIINWIEKQKQCSFRWQLLAAAYYEGKVGYA